MGKNKILKFYSSELCYENNGQRVCQHTLRYDKQTIGVFANFFDLLVKINSLNLVARLWVRQNKKFSLVVRFPFKRSLDSLNTADIQMLLDKIADPSSTGDIIEQLQYTEEEFVQVLEEQNNNKDLNISKTINKILFDVESDDEPVECEICQERLREDEIDCGCDSIEIHQADFEGFSCDCPTCLSDKHAHTHEEPKVAEEPLYSCECAKCLGQEVDEPLNIIEATDCKCESCVKGFGDIKPIVIDESTTQDYPCHCQNNQQSNAQLIQTYFDESLYSCNCVDCASEQKQVEEFADEPEINVGTLLSNSCKGVRCPISKEETFDESKTEVLEPTIDESKTAYELPYECFCHECQNPAPSNLDYFLWFKQSQPKQIDYTLPYECQCHLCSGQEIELSLDYILAETSVNKEQLEEVSIADEPIIVDNFESKSEDLCNCDHLECDEPQLDPIVNLDHLNTPVFTPTTTATNFECPACQHVATCDFCQKYKLYLLEALECPGCQKLFADHGISIEELLKSYFPHISYDGKSHGSQLCSLSTSEQECPLAKLKDQKFIASHDGNQGIIYTPEDGVNSGDYDELLEGNVNTKRGYGGGGVGGPAIGQGVGRFAVDDTSAIIGAVSEKNKPDEEIVLVTTKKTGFWGIPAYVLWFIVFALIAAIIIIVVMFFVFGSGLI